MRTVISEETIEKRRIAKLEKREAENTRGMKICSSCKFELPLDDFSPMKNANNLASAVTSNCKLCTNEQQAIYRKKQKLKALQIN